MSDTGTQEHLMLQSRRELQGSIAASPIPWCPRQVLQRRVLNKPSRISEPSLSADVPGWILPIQLSDLQHHYKCRAQRDAWYTFTRSNGGALPFWTIPTTF